MKWCLTVLFLMVWVDVNGQSITDNEKHRCKFGKYKKCMTNYGISTWKIVDSTSNSTYFNIFNYQWNKYFDYVFPIAIFVPYSVFDVQATVKCGYKAKIQIVPNSGAHSYAGLSLGTNDSIIVDFRFMKSIAMNIKEGSVTVGVGALVGHINAKLWKNGGWGTPLGNCMTVGMGGHGIGGGISIFSSLYGLVIDNILEIKMVDASGNAVTVNPSHNTDLWWAMRGVGPGYIGLVTSFKLKMFKAKDLKLTTVQIQFKLKDFQNVMGSFVKWLDWVKHNEPTIASFVIAVNDNYTSEWDTFLNPGVEVQIVHIQDPKIQPNSNTAFLAAFPKIFPEPIKRIVNYPSYIEMVVATSFTPVIHPSQTTSSEPQPTTLNETIATKLEKTLEFFSILNKEMALPRYAFEKSFFVNRKFSAQDFNEVQNVLLQIPNVASAVVISSQQGAIGEPQSTDCAYVHRDNLFDMRIRHEGFNSEEVGPGKAWIEKFVKAARFMDSGETYQNFPDPELKNYLIRYYGINLGKLIKIKRKWDPKGYFNTEQSIPI